MRADPHPAHHRWAALLVLMLLAVGCGARDPDVMTFPGTRVARIAEAQLESAHPALAPGTMTCSDLEFVVGARTRCARTSSLSRGREVRVLGTVTVTGTSGGGKLHVTLDDAAADYGLDGAWLAQRLRAWMRDRGRTVTTADCPDLLGEIGRTAACTAGGATVGVRVTGTEPATFDVRYRFELPGPKGG